MGTSVGKIDFGIEASEDKFKLQEGVYVDFDFPTSQLKSTGVVLKPDYDIVNLGYLMPKNNTTEKIGGSRQFFHEWIKESTIYPHIHIIQSENVQYVFEAQYRVYDVGGLVPAFSSTVQSIGYSKPYVSGSLHQVVNFSPITLTGITGNSAWFDVQIWRNDNVGTGDVLLKGFDCHILVDRLGSVGEFLY